MRNYPVFTLTSYISPTNARIFYLKLLDILPAMPRLRSDSAIRKSARTKEVKEEIRLRKARLASKRYRLRNKQRLNEEASNRMSQNASEMSEDQKEAFKERRKATAKKYYLKKRDEILKKADDKRWRAWVKVHGEVGWWTYRPRKAKRRVGLPDATNSEEDAIQYN